MAGDEAELISGRGRDLTRLAAFSDGVFAIAITLLVLQISLPSDIGDNASLWSALGDQAGDFWAYGLSFVVIGAFWMGHHRMLRSLDAYDPALMWLNLAYLAFTVLIPFFSQMLGDYGDLGLAAFLYALNLGMISVCAVLLTFHASRAGLYADGFAEQAPRVRNSLAFMAAVFIFTAPFAFLVGSWMMVSWIALAFNPFDRDPVRRRRRRSHVRA